MTLPLLAALTLHALQAVFAPLPHADSRRSWEKEGRPALLAAWNRVLGGEAAKPQKVEIETLGEEILAKVIRRRIRYGVEPDRWTEAYLLLPRGLKGRMPGVVVFHSTTAENIRQPAGVEGDEDKFIGLRLAERGFAALCPRCYIYDDPKRSFAEMAADVPRRHTGWTGMRQMLWDGQRALDVLASLPVVDSSRLGAIGHSLGAKETLYLAAFDSRVKTAVFSEGGIGLGSSNWEADWYLGRQIRKPGFARDHHELLALCAPRPILLLGGDSADGKASQSHVEAARPIYQLYGLPSGIVFVNHHMGHAYPPEAKSAVYAWLEDHLKKRK